MSGISILKAQYAYIKFPFKSSIVSSNTIFSLYLEEFGAKDVLNIKTFVALLLSGVRDFLEGNLTEWDIESLVSAVYMTKISQPYLIAPYLWEHDQLLTLISELGDIYWVKETSNSNDYKIYLNELHQRWEQIVEFYEEYFKKHPLGEVPTEPKNLKRNNFVVWP